MKKTIRIILIIIAAIVVWFLIGKADEARTDRIYNRGFEDGVEYGKSIGYTAGYSEGYDFGWNDGFYEGLNHEET